MVSTTILNASGLADANMVIIELHELSRRFRKYQNNIPEYYVYIFNSEFSFTQYGSVYKSTIYL